MDKFEPIKIPQTQIDDILRFIAEHKNDIEEVSKNLVIRDDIFSLLNKYCTVIYFPSNDVENNGFHTSYPFNGDVLHFVYINTAQHKEKQIFTAAHELGHIWELEERFESYKLNDFALEHIINRFAAELLMPSDIFRPLANKKIQEIRKDDSIKFGDIIQIITSLMNEFFTSYKSVVYRLYELRLIKEQTATILWGDKSIRAKIEEYSKKIAQEQGYIRLYQTDKRKYVDGLKDLLDDALKRECAPEEWLKAFYTRFEFDIEQEYEILEDSLQDIFSKEDYDNV